MTLTIIGTPQTPQRRIHQILHQNIDLLDPPLVSPHVGVRDEYVISSVEEGAEGKAEGHRGRLGGGGGGGRECRCRDREEREGRGFAAVIFVGGGGER